ncbi:MAG: transposase [Phascolarctobacterium sp.]|nr:transposase [Phascolarctobacterium sp.]
MKCIRTYCFKLYNSKKNKKLHRQINAAGLIYNHCIALHKRYHRLFKKQLNANRLKVHLAKIKKLERFSYIREIGSQAVQDIAERIDRAYKLFFENLKRKVRTAPPSFKKITKYKSLTLKQAGYKFLDGNRLRIKDTIFKYFKSREFEGKIKTLTIKRDALADIYIYVVCQIEENEVLARTGEMVGFDFGLKKFLTASNGKDIEAPLFFKENANAIRQANRNLTRKKNGSNNRKKAKLVLARLHKKVTNQRSNFHWQLANILVGQYADICIEDLNLKGIQKLYGRKITDLGFSEFVKILEYKASHTGARVLKVDRFYASSQTCSCCGAINFATKDLRVRTWTCPECGSHHDRDRNAAINIVREAEMLNDIA